MQQYYFTEEHELFRSSLRAFCEKELAPHIDQWEGDRKIPREIFSKMGEMGYFGLMFPEKYGGLEVDFFYSVIFLEELARLNSGGFSASMMVHPYVVLPYLNNVANETQKEKYLIPGIEGTKIGCLCITEPNTGSDVQALQTTAKKEGDHYIINGAKTFITNGVYSDFLVVAAKMESQSSTEDKAPLSLFLVDRNTEGLSATNIEKLGWHASDTGEISFVDVKVPAENLIGNEGQGFLYIMQHFVLERLIMAVSGVASAEFAMEKALQYMSEREAFGRPINKFQALRHDIANMASETEVQKLFNYDLCKRFDQGQYIVKEAAMAKLNSSDLALRVADGCLQMFGGYGFTEEYPLARMYRDNRLGPIGGGTSEILCEIIAKMAIDGVAYNSESSNNACAIVELSEEHEMFRESLRAFLKKEVLPNIEEWEANRRTPKEIWKKMGDMGFLGLSYPEEYGGKGLDFFYDVIFNEELGRTNSGGFAITQQVTQYMSSPYILKYASEELKQKYLPKIISGEWLASIGITEPGAGSDVQNIRTKAIKDESGEFYIVDGSKTFITNAVYGDFIITVVKTNPSLGAAGVSLLIIDRNAEGVSARKIKKLGWWSSDTAELSFDSVKVPVSNLIGDEGKGFYYLMNGLQLERLVALPAGIASMENAFEESLKYMSERKAFGRSINRFQVLRHRMATMMAEVTALKSFVYQCCKIYADGIYDVKLCSMGKLLVTEKVNEVASKCLQFFGGYGFTEAYPMARFYRDCRVGTIGAGTSQVMRNIIAKMVIDDVGYQAAKAPAASSGNGSLDNGASFNRIYDKIVEKAGNVNAIGKKLKIKLPDGSEEYFIYVDGTTAQNLISQSNKEADCTITVDFADFKSILKGKMNPMNAMMTGKLKIDGDMSVAMSLQKLMG